MADEILVCNFTLNCNWLKLIVNSMAKLQIINVQTQEGRVMWVLCSCSGRLVLIDFYNGITKFQPQKQVIKHMLVNSGWMRGQNGGEGSRGWAKWRESACQTILSMCPYFFFSFLLVLVKLNILCDLFFLIIFGI